MHWRLLLTVMFAFLHGIARPAPGVIAEFFNHEEQRADRDHLRKSFTYSTVSISNNNPLQPIPDLTVYIMPGDITESFDKPSFRTDGAIMSTNTSGDLAAHWPAVQRLLVSRVKVNPKAFDKWEKSANQAKLGLGSGSYTVEFDTTEKQNSFPRAACFIATDHRGGNSIKDREFFRFERLSAALAKCFESLDNLEVESVILPLIGSAGEYTRGEMLLNEREAMRLQCRMINSIIAIGMGIGHFNKTRKHIKEIGIIILPNDIEKQFFLPPVVKKGEKANIASYQLFSSIVASELDRSLKFSTLYRDAFPGPTCDDIFGFPPRP